MPLIFLWQSKQNKSSGCFVYFLSKWKHCTFCRYFSWFWNYIKSALKLCLINLIFFPCRFLIGDSQSVLYVTNFFTSFSLSTCASWLLVQQWQSYASKKLKMYVLYQGLLVLEGRSIVKDLSKVVWFFVVKKGLRGQIWGNLFLDISDNFYLQKFW